MDKPLPCIVCGYQPEPAIKDWDNKLQPYKATMFDSHGQYGSTVFDPISGDLTLMINVCDACLRARCDRVIEARRIPRGPAFEYNAWKPYEPASP
jgi:hypothetical protein